jgi:FKBP-type peptidyl-prolyl cis-trans isomerase FklB
MPIWKKALFAAMPPSGNLFVKDAKPRFHKHILRSEFAMTQSPSYTSTMKKTRVITVALWASTAIFAGSARAQQSATGSGQEPLAGASSQTAPAVESQPAPGPDAGQSTAAKRPAEALTLKTNKDKLSYAIGMNVGRHLHAQSVDVNLAILLQGLKDELSGGTTLLTDMEETTVLAQLQQDVRKKADETRQAIREPNKKAGDAFLAANKTKEGVVTLPSGLQYKILREGIGPKPSVTDFVVCNYRGSLIDGTEFDNSYKRGEPATFPVGNGIKGWTEALQLMPVGSKWRLFVPPNLAYGETGAGPDIGPDATLIFEVELISIKGKQ